MNHHADKLLQESDRVSFDRFSQPQSEHEVVNYELQMIEMYTCPSCGTNASRVAAFV